MTTLAIATPRVFLPLLQPARVKACFGGRGSGKSWFFASLLIERCLMQPGFRAVCVREIQKSLKDSVKRLLEDQIAAMGVGAHFNILNDQIGTPGGGSIVFVGMQDHTAESIKSLEGFDVAWVEEAQSLSARSLELLRPTIRKPGSELHFTYNPRNPSDPIDLYLRGPEPPPNSIIVRANWSDNPYFPAELEAERQHDKRTKPDRYDHIWEGAHEPSAIGAIFDRLMFHRNRRAQAPEMARIVVAVDPAVSSGDGADEHGIVVCGVGQDGRGYVLEDASMRGSPRQWADRAVAMMDLYGADAIVIERNQGGDMCRATIESVRPYLRVIEVHATRGKHVRAEPISALYALDRISHVGTFDKLESQLCQITTAGYEGEGSPDHADAAIWGLTELFPQVTAPRDPPNREREPDYGSYGGGSGAWMG